MGETNIQKVDEIIPEHPDKYPLANVFISKGSYAWKNIETQLFNIGLSKPEKRYDSATKKIKTMAIISVSEINALRTKSGEINYGRAKKAADSLSKAFIRIEDKQNRKYTHINVLERVQYENGQYTLVFTDSIVGMGFISPKKDYTNVLMAVNRMSDAYGIRLYQNLKSKCFGKTDINGYYQWVVEVDRLKLLIGFIDTENEEFKKSENEHGLESDDLHVIDILKTKSKKSESGISNIPYVPYLEFKEFKRKVLDKYVKEINEKMDISVKYQKVQTQGKRVEKLKFLVKLKERNVPSEEKIKELLFAMNDFLTARDVNWTATQLRELLAEAGYDINIVRNKYKLLQQQDPDKIRNRYGWLRDAVRFDYQDDAPADAVDIDDAPEEKDMFENLWNMYQKRTRKDLISKKVKREIEAVGYDEVQKAIENYESVIEENHRNGFDRARMSGGQFFSKGYKDYLPAVFDQMTDEEKGYIGNGKNKFTGNEQRTSMDYAAMAEQEEMDKVLHGFE